MARILILGAGGTGRDIVDWLPELRAAGASHEVLGLLDDDPAKQGKEILGVPVLGPLSTHTAHPDALLVDALGSPGSYRRRAELLAGIDDARWLTLRHPLARISASARIGAASLVYPFTFIGPGVTLGRHVTVLAHATLNHGTTVGEFAILASRVAVGGDVTIGASVYLGMGSTVREGTRIGAGAMVGMGAVVTSDVAAGATVVGVPARPLDR